MARCSSPSSSKQLLALVQRCQILLSFEVYFCPEFSYFFVWLVFARGVQKLVYSDRYLSFPARLLLHLELCLDPLVVVGRPLHGRPGGVQV